MARSYHQFLQCLNLELHVQWKGPVQYNPAKPLRISAPIPQSGFSPDLHGNYCKVLNLPAKLPLSRASLSLHVSSHPVARMNHPRWLPSARAILVVRNRLANARFSTSSAKLNETRSKVPRRNPSATTNNRFNNGRKPQGQSSSPNDATKHKLVLSGLPTTLLPADFNRLAADSLAGWNEIISHGTSTLRT